MQCKNMHLKYQKYTWRGCSRFGIISGGGVHFCNASCKMKHINAQTDPTRFVQCKNGQFHLKQDFMQCRNGKIEPEK